jgi:hypothetical protein
MREKFLSEQRVISVVEELACFLRTEAIDDKAQFSCREAPTTSTPTSNSRGISGIFAERGHR